LAAVAILLVFIVVLLDVIASVRVVRSDIALRGQKTWQLLFVWMVPLIGAIIALAVTSEARAGFVPRRPGEPGNTTEMGAGYGGDLSGNTHHGHSHDSHSGSDSSFGGHS